MFEDTEAGASLHAITEVTAPPATTTVEQVLRLGRRRKFLQRAATAAVALAVLAGIGVGATVLRAPADSGLGVATPSSTAPTPLVGWDQVPTMLSATGCQAKATPTAPRLAMPSQERLIEIFVGTLKETFGRSAKVVYASTGTWKSGEAKALLDATYSMDREGPFGMRWEVSSFGGTPVEKADAELGYYDTGVCEPPRRHISPDGTVFQLYPQRVLGPGRTSKGLHIYRPNNRMLVLTAKSFYEHDPRAHPDGRLVDDATLVAIGKKLAAAIEE